MAAGTSLYELREEASRAAERARIDGRDDWARQWEAVAEAVQDVILDEGEPALDDGGYSLSVDRR